MARMAIADHDLTNDLKFGRSVASIIAFFLEGTGAAASGILVTYE